MKIFETKKILQIQSQVAAVFTTVFVTLAK